MNPREADPATSTTLTKRDETDTHLEHSSSGQVNGAKSIVGSAATAEPSTNTSSERKPTAHGYRQAPFTSRKVPSEPNSQPKPTQNPSGKRSKFGLTKSINPRNIVGVDTHRNTARNDVYSTDPARPEIDVKKYVSERDAERQKHEQLRLDYCQDVEKLKAERQRDREELERVKRSAHHLQTILDNKQFFLGQQATDDDMRTRFSSILTSIKTWSTHFMYGPVEASSKADDQLDRYQCVLPLCTHISHVEAVVAAKKQRRLLVRGWTAFIACGCILGPNTSSEVEDIDLWLDSKAARSFTRLERRISSTDQEKIPHRVLNDWRAWTAELLSMAIDEKKFRDSSQPAIRDAAKEVMGLVGSLALPSKVQELETALCEIYVEAVRFAQLLRQQRAEWSVKFPSRPKTPVESRLMFDPSYMRNELDGDETLNEETSRQQLVEMTVTPALFKRGNANGEHYDKEITVVPAGVTIYGW